MWRGGGRGRLRRCGSRAGCGATARGRRSTGRASPCAGARRGGRWRDRSCRCRWDPRWRASAGRRPTVERWAGVPHWLAIWGPTGTGKTGLATVLLAEHLRTGKRGRWISGPELSRRIQRDFHNAEDVLAPLLSTSLLVLDEPLTGAGADWYTERLLLITRTRDDRGLPTIVTSQLLPELLAEQVPTTPPPILSRWLSGLHVNGELGTDDVRLQGAL